MSHQRDVIEQKGRNQIVRIRSDSETNLDDLFKAVMHPKDSQVPLSVPMRLRNLPPSFFKQPERGSKSASHSRESSSDTTYSAPPQSSSLTGGQQRATGLSINHPRAHSSPATLQQTYNAVTSPQHHRQPSFDITDEMPLPPGWDMAKTPSGQRYFLNHITQTTTWEDPRKKLGTGVHSGSTGQSSPIPTTAPPPHSSTTVSAHSVNLQNLGALPEGWEQATTPEGEVYFINHIERTTSWFDPRIPVHLQRPPVMQSHSNAHSQQTRPPPVLTSPPPPPPPPPPPATQQQSQVQASSAAPVVSQPAIQSITSQASMAAAITTITGAVNTQLSLQQQQQQQQQKMRLQQLQMERERLRMRQEEILRQTVQLGYPMNNELLLRRTLGEELTIPTSPTSSSTDLPPVTTTGIDPFLGGTDFHSRQESTDSGLGLGPNYSLPNTPEDFLSNMDENIDAAADESTQGTDMGLDSLQGSNMDLGTENMDSDDLVPSLQEELNADILNDVEALLNSNKEVLLTWL